MKNAKELSKRFKDRPKTPKEEIIYWTDYVIKHKGAHHLKPMGIRLPWYQYFLIDVIFTIFSIMFIGLGIILFIIKVVKNLFCFILLKLKQN